MIQKEDLRNIQKSLDDVMRQTLEERKKNNISMDQVSNDIIDIYDDIEKYVLRIKSNCQEAIQIGEKLKISNIKEVIGSGLSWQD